MSDHRFDNVVDGLNYCSRCGYWDGAAPLRQGIAQLGAPPPSIRDLLDDTILRLGLCDRVDLERMRSHLDAIEAQRASGLKGWLNPLTGRPRGNPPGDQT